MATAEAYLSLLGVNVNIIRLIIGISMFLGGGVIFIKHRHVTRFVNAVSGSYFIGYFTLLVGLSSIVYDGPKEPVMATKAVIGMAIALSMVGGILGTFFPTIGRIFLGCASGWSAWSIFGGLLPSPLGNLILCLIMSIIGGVAIFFKPEKTVVIARSWFGSALLTTGCDAIILNSVVIAETPPYTTLIISFSTYIVTIAITFILFAIHLSRSEMKPKDFMDDYDEKSII